MLVPAGQGYYNWIDYNQNNIQEHGEFEKALLHADAQYLKFYRQGDILIDYFDKHYHLELLLNGNQLVKNNFLRYFRIYSLVEYHYKTEKNQPKNHQNFLFLDKKIHSETLFKKNKLSFSGTFLSNSYFNIYSNGGETKIIVNKFFLTEYNLTEYIKSAIKLGIKDNQTINEFYILRNYGYQHFFSHQNIHFEESNKLHLSLEHQLNYYRTNNQIFSKIQSLGINTQIMKNKTSVIFSIDLLKVNFHEKTNTPMAFEILQQNQNGYNLDIELQWKRTIRSDINFLLSYQSKIHQDVVLQSGIMQISKKF